MTDFDYDCYIKKGIAHSAAKRKCGSKSKKCSLPSDKITTKEWKERCGDVMSYQIGKPMVWAEFQRLPRDLKEEYLKMLIEKYSVNARNMADMFGVNPATVFRVVKNDGLDVKFLKGKHPVGEKKDAYERFLRGEPSVEMEETCDVTQEEETIETPENVMDVAKIEDRRLKEVTKTRLDSFTMNFSGEVNVEMIANSLRYILASGGNAKIQITCELA